MSNTDHPHSRAQASCDGPINSLLGNPPPSCFTAGESGSLYQQDNKGELAKEEGQVLSLTEAGLNLIKLLLL